MSNPTVHVGDVVVVLGWAYSNVTTVPHVGTVHRVSVPTRRRVCVSHPDRSPPGAWAESWSLPTQEELTAYQLAQLTESGL